MRKFYVASSFKNVDTVRYVSQKLKDVGYIHTYDWTQNGRALTFEALRSIGEQEKSAVKDSDFVIVILPAGKGSHIEMGMALGFGKKIFLYSPNKAINDFETTSTFYHLSEVEQCFGSIEDLLAKVTELTSV